MHKQFYIPKPLGIIGDFHMKPNIEKVDHLLRKIRVMPLAAESFGVRSMCTFVETPDLKILLDAGVSLCPYRFGLSPHPIEFQTISLLRKFIAAAADKAEVVTISHYHFDHHTPSFEDWVVNWTESSETARQIYQDKIVLIKNSKEKINYSQRQRAWTFRKTAGKYAKMLETADGKTFAFGKTLLHFSEAIAHGSEDLKLGWVIMVVVEHEEERFMFAPDVQGPISNRTLNLILDSGPDVIMLGGPPLYLEGSGIDRVDLEHGLSNLNHIVEKIPLVILEHHALRDAAWKSKIEDVFQKAYETEHRIMTAAEYIGKENAFFESAREELFRRHPPSDEFRIWMKTLSNKKIMKPPL